MAATDRLQILDLLRFIAAFSVMTYHLTFQPAFLPEPDLPLFEAIGAVSRYGFLGVELFFLISGFVIFWSADNRSAVEFATSRVSRLFPSYWVCVLITLVVLIGLERNTQTISSGMIAANLSMLAGFLGYPYVDGVYWTLQAELKFYFLVFVLVALRQMPRIELWLFAWLGCLLVAFFTQRVPGLRSLVIYPYGPFFVAGGFFFMIWRKGWTLQRTIALLCCCALSCWTVVEVGAGFLAGDRSLQSHVVCISVVIGLYLLFFGISTRSITVRESWVWLTLGSLTYPLYLLHNEVGKAVAASVAHNLGPVGAVLLGAAVPLLLAFVLAKTVERNGCRWMRTQLLQLVSQPSSAKPAKP